MNIDGCSPAVADSVARIALGITYHGGAYQGWQSQPSGLTIQDRVEAALTLFVGNSMRVNCAGRTDAGVHALMQVVHLDSPVSRDSFSWVRGTNAFLPKDIAVEWAKPVPDQFHARASALARRYIYVLKEAAVRPALESGLVGWVFRPLDRDAMLAAAMHLVGKHDFTSFRASGCQSPSPIKTMSATRISRQGAYWRFEFQADAFLHHMIRNIMGCLIAVGSGQRSPEWVGEVLAARNRDAAAPTFPPDGLYFAGPVYAPQWGLPDRTPAFDWIPNP